MSGEAGLSHKGQQGVCRTSSFQERRLGAGEVQRAKATSSCGAGAFLGDGSVTAAPACALPGVVCSLSGV